MGVATPCSSTSTLKSTASRSNAYPGYAPELNPVEGLWSSLKGRELANRCESTIGAVVDAANVGVLRIRTEQLAFSFLDHTSLFLNSIQAINANLF